MGLLRTRHRPHDLGGLKPCFFRLEYVAAIERLALPWRVGVHLVIRPSRQRMAPYARPCSRASATPLGSPRAAKQADFQHGLTDCQPIEEPPQGVTQAVDASGRQTREAVIRRMETFSVVQIPATLSGRPWGIVRNDGHGGQSLLPSTYETEAEAPQAAQRLASQPPMDQPC
jgi:hypothetical protein